jgi:spermidine synthase
MTSLFHEAESQLAILGLQEINREPLDVMVGGLGLGYTAVEALKDPRIESLVIIDYLAAVIGWHEQELVPLGKTLNEDTRCELKNADFFELIRNEPIQKMDVILLDIDHTPTHVLHQSNQHFYTEAGLTELTKHLKPGGVFAMWADGAPESFFTKRLRSVFPQGESHTIEFDNPITGGTSIGAVYTARI